MLKITRETDYAILIMTQLANSDRLNASEVAQKTNLNLPIVSKLLKILAKDELLVSTRGTQGGYQLSKSANLISLVDVIRSVEGQLSINDCAGTESYCSRRNECSLAPHWIKINQAILETLSGILLSDLSNQSNS